MRMTAQNGEFRLDRRIPNVFPFSNFEILTVKSQNTSLDGINNLQPIVLLIPFQFKHYTASVRSGENQNSYSIRERKIHVDIHQDS